MEEDFIFYNPVSADLIVTGSTTRGQRGPAYFDYDNSEYKDLSPSEDDYKEAQRDKIRSNAIYNMLNVTRPVVPQVPHKFSLKEALEMNAGNILPAVSMYAAQYIIPDNIRKSLFGLNKDAETCIMTALSQYGPQYAVSGNKTFARNHKKYGFIKISKEQAREGDLVQLWGENGPHHLGMITGFDENGKFCMSQSHGLQDPSQIDIDGASWDNLKEDKVYYRFVGTKEDNKNWRKDWKRKFGNKK